MHILIYSNFYPPDTQKYVYTQLLIGVLFEILKYWEQQHKKA